MIQSQFRRSRTPITTGLALIAMSIFTAGLGFAQPIAEPPPQKVATPAAKAEDVAIPAGARATPQSAAVLAEWTKRYCEHIHIIADPSMEGRVPGSNGIAKAAQYIEDQIKSFGLKPAFPAEGAAQVANDAAEKDYNAPKVSYRQMFKQGSKLKAVTQEMTIDGKALEVGKDFNPIGQSGSGEVSGQIAFAGYSIVDGESGYQSYPEGTDLTGKIVMVLRFEPMNDEGKSKWQQGSGWSMHAGLEPKITAAISHGAAGVIVVNPPGAADARIGKLENIESMTGRKQQGAPVVMMTTEAADDLVKHADSKGRSLQDLRKLADEGGGVIELDKSKVSINIKLERTSTQTDNVAGILPGRGELADQFIIIGSHYDHLGTGNFGSLDPNAKGKLHPGADDNGSGTSGNILVAEYLAKAYAELAKTEPNRPMRSIMFQWYSAEESGLIGSRYYTKHMSIPPEKHVFMLNMDMIGRLREGKMEMTGTATAEGLKEWVAPYVAHSGLDIIAKGGGRGPSDHQSFFDAKVPALFFFTLLHEQYHRPTDTVDTINCAGAAQVCDLVYRFALDLAAMPTAMTFSDNDESNKSEQPIAGPKETKSAHGGVPNGDQPAPAPMKVRFGIAPGDYSGSEPGVLVGEVFPETSAADAGVKQGDLLTTWNSTPIKTIEDWTEMLRAAKPGDEVTIDLLRKGEKVTVKAKLKARAGDN